MAPAPAGTGSADDGGPLSLVGLGDSIPGELFCAERCRSYVVEYGGMAQTALGRDVVVTNLATNDGVTSITLISRLQTQDDYRMAVADADLISLTIGFNDWAGACVWPTREGCVPDSTQRTLESIGIVLHEVAAIRGDRATVLRVTTYYNYAIGNPIALTDWSYTKPDSAPFDALYSAALAALNGGICDQVEAHAAVCVAPGPAVNGPGAIGTPWAISA